MLEGGSYMNNFIVSAACIIAVLIGMMNLLENEMIPKNKKEQFDLLGLTIILEIIIDAVIIYSSGQIMESHVGYRALRLAENCISPVVAMLFSKVMTRKSFWKKIRGRFIYLISINAVCQLSTFFIPTLFNIDAETICSQTPYTCTYIIILIVCIILLLISANNTIIQNYTRVSYTLLSTAILLSAGIIVKGIFPTSNADWLCVTFCYLIFMVYICNSYLKIDSLTTLLNRRAFDNRLMSVNYSTALIVIDANNFKSINDTYGYQSGDKGLVKISEVIFTVYGKVGFCYRIGGDEFCVILKKGMLNKMTFETEHCDSFDALDNITNRLNEKIKGAVKKYPMLEHGVAQGYSIYTNKQDSPGTEKSDNIKEVFRLADKRMYLNKMKGKTKHEHTDITKLKV